MTNPLVGDLQKFLCADAGVNAIVGTRVYPTDLPQSVTYPAISYTQASGIRVHHLLGPAGKVRRRVSVECWAKTNIESWTLADAVRRALDGFAGMMGSTTVGSTKLDNEIAFFEEEAEVTGVRRILQDYIIAHLED